MVFAAKHSSTQHAILDIVNAILCNTLVKNMVNYLTLARQFVLTAVKLQMSGTLLLEHFYQHVPFIFHFSQLSGIFITQKQHTCLQKLFLMPKNPCKKYFVEQKQIKTTTAAYSKLRMLIGGKTCHAYTQLEHSFSSRVHACLDATDVK